jgi:hypothetical protein
MTDDDDNMFRRPTGTRMERAQEIMSRAHCMRPEAALTEDEIERRNVEAKLRLEQHDAYFSPEFVSLGGPRPISRKLARYLGYDVEPADNGHGDMGMMGDPDQSPRPVLDYGDD